MTTRSSEYLTPDEVIARWRGMISKSTLDNWRSTQNRGPRFVKIGGRVLYPLDEVVAYEQRNLRGIPNHTSDQPNP